MKFFLAGIMQGSRGDEALHDQRYRGRLKRIIEEVFSDADIHDPLADHQDSLSYDEARARDVFYYHNRLCREVDVVVAFVPSASMGTAIEMWEAHEHGRAAVIAISPLRHNWAIRYCSHEVFASLEEFEHALRRGELVARIDAILHSRARRGT